MISVYSMLVSGYRAEPRDDSPMKNTTRLIDIQKYFKLLQAANALKTLTEYVKKNFPERINGDDSAVDIIIDLLEEVKAVPKKSIWQRVKEFLGL